MNCFRHLPALILSFLLLSTLALAAGFQPVTTEKDRCVVGLFHSSLKNSLKTQTEILSQFNLQNIREETIQPISYGNYFVRTKDGYGYALRFEDKTFRLEREKFAADFVKVIPGQRVTEVRILERQESYSFLRKTQKIDPVQYETIIDNTKSSPRASVTIFFPVSTGKDAMDEWAVNNPILNLLELAKKKPSMLKSSFADEFLFAPVARLEPSRRLELENGIKAIIPEARDLSGDALLHHLIDNPRLLTSERLGALSAQTLAKVPPAVITQLNDQWANYTILGITDFHSGNWLLHENAVMAIDLADIPRAAPKGKNPFMMGQRHPLGISSLSNEMIDKMILDTSPKLKAYYRDLKRESIVAIAQKAGYKIPEKELNAIMERIQYFNSVAKLVH